MGYFVYKWVLNNEIVYIGKTMNPKQRFYQESRLEKFSPYLDADIFISEFINSTEMSATEKILINKYQPVLNVVDTHKESMELPFDDSKLKWTQYENPVKASKIGCEKRRFENAIEEIKDGIWNCYFVRIICQNWQSMYLSNIGMQTFEDGKIDIDTSWTLKAFYLGDDKSDKPVSLRKLFKDECLEDYKPLFDWEHEKIIAGSILFTPWTKQPNVYTLSLYTNHDDDEEGEFELVGYIGGDYDGCLFQELSSIIDFLREKEMIRRDELEAKELEYSLWKEQNDIE